MSKYRTKLRELAQRRTTTARRARAGRRGTERRFPIGLLSTVGKFGLSTLAPRGAAQEVEMEMEHARKMALVDPRMLDTLRSPPPATDTLGKAEGAEGVPATSATSGIEADVVDTVPKTMQTKAKRLMEHMKRNISWTARGATDPRRCAGCRK